MSNYEIEKSPIWLDIQDVFKSGKKPIKFDFKGQLHTEKQDIPLLKIITIDVIRDYVKYVGDHVTLKFSMPLGDYISKLYPYRANLEVSIKKIELEETSGKKETGKRTSIERYKAVFIPEANPHVNTSQLETYDTASLNLMDVVTVQLQLLNRSLEPLRIKTVGGIYRHLSHKTMIHGVLAGESNKVLVDGKPAVDAVDIVEPDNKALSKHIVVKEGTMITALPSYLHEHNGGVYTSGVGTYLQTFKGKKTWFVYPLLNLTRFDQDVEKVIFYALPANRFPEIDRSYQQEGKTIKVLVNSARKYKDSADTDEMNHGSGFRLAHAGSFMKKPVEITEKGAVAKRTNLNYEVAHRSRADGLNYAPVVPRISSNPYREYSKVLARNIARLDFSWQNANPDLIYPGMPCKYIFLSNNKPVELKGVILYVHAFSTLHGTGLSTNVYKTQCHVVIATEKTSNLPDITITESPGEF